MRFINTVFEGCFVIDIEKNTDERGFFARTFDKKLFNCEFLQDSISFNKKKGTIRGLHYQESPYEEAKLVRCTSGSIFDVVVDPRKESSTFGKWFGTTLSAKNHKMIFIPKGFAHGFQTLEDNTEVFYQITENYHQEKSAGIRYDSFGIRWPVKNHIVSKKDILNISLTNSRTN